jgi:hypothetical protein
MLTTFLYYLGRLLLIADNVHSMLESADHRYAAPLVHTQRVGRPKYNVTKEQILYLRDQRFSWTAIADMLGKITFPYNNDYDDDDER